MPIVKRATLLNVSLLILSTVTVSIVCEIAYRFHLYYNLKLTYSVADKPMTEYDDSLGYRYIPNTKTVVASFYEGEQREYHVVSVGPYGNIGDGVTSWGDDDFKILALGDSFTANPVTNVSWTDYFADSLSRFVGRNVQVMNLGRDGFGVLQMVRLAKATLRRTKPDLLIIAFINNDLGRLCSWRSAIKLRGCSRVIASSERSLIPNMSFAMDVRLINENINLPWCKKVFDERTADPLVAELNSQLRTLAAENLSVSLLSPETSFLYKRVVHRDPFWGARKSRFFLSFKYDSFEKDSAFVEDLNDILSSGVPVVFFQVPDYNDLKAGQSDFRSNEKGLFNSLVRLMPDGPTSLIDYVDLNGQSPETFFFFPIDLHPTSQGARMYANAMLKAFQRRSELRKILIRRASSLTVKQRKDLPPID